VTTLQLLRVTYLLSPPRTARAQSAGVGLPVWLSDGVTMDDVSVCVVRKSKMLIVSRVVPFDYGNNLSSTVM